MDNPNNSRARLGTVFGKTWDLFFTNFQSFFWPAVIILIIISGLELLISLLFKSDSLSIILLGLLLSVIIGALGSAVFFGSIYSISKETYEDGNLSVGQGVKTGFGNSWKFLLTILRIAWYILWPLLLIAILFTLITASLESGPSTTEFTTRLGADELPQESIREFIESYGFALMMGFMTIISLFIGLFVWRYTKSLFTLSVLTDNVGGANTSLKESIRKVKGQWWRIFGSKIFAYSFINGFINTMMFLLFVSAIILITLFTGINLPGAEIQFGIILFAAIIALLAISIPLNTLFNYVLYKES